MKSNKKILIIAISCLLTIQPAYSQKIDRFPFNPYEILKSWNYERLIKEMGAGDEVISSMRNQEYISGMSYSTILFGVAGKLTFNFSKDSISRIDFRKEHSLRLISEDLSNQFTRDTTLRKDYNNQIRALDSLRRDSVVKSITDILGLPLVNGPTASAEKNAKHSAIWINHGYSCLYKDYQNYSEIVLSLSTIPLWVVGEFGLFSRTEILKKCVVNTKKMAWTASLLGMPSNVARMMYSDVYLLLEYSTGQKYLESIPKGLTSYFYTNTALKIATGQSFQLQIPNQSISYLPDLTFEDCDGDAIPEAWITTSSEPNQQLTRHFLYSLKYREPNLIYNYDELAPESIKIIDESKVIISWQHGPTEEIEPASGSLNSIQNIQLNPRGFKYFKSTKLNSDGSANFIGGIELPFSPEGSSFGILEITYKHISGGWEPEQIKIIPKKGK
jgi:hypothetical protein